MWEAWASIRESRDAGQDFVSASYFELLRNYRRHGWIVLYLFGVSPTVCKSFLRARGETLPEFGLGTAWEPNATSLRMSDLGYRNRNQSGVEVSVNSLSDYVRDLTRAISTPHPEYERLGVKVDGEYRQLNANLLQIENEYYSFIRPKRVARSGERPTKALLRAGVEYVEVRALDASTLSAADAGDYFLLRRDLELSLEGFRFGAWMMPVSGRNGPHQDIAQMGDLATFTDLKDYDAYINRLLGVPGSLLGTMEVMRAGIEAGLLPPKVTVEQVPLQIRAARTSLPDALRKPFNTMPKTIAPADRERLLRDFERTLVPIDIVLTEFEAFFTPKRAGDENQPSEIHGGFALSHFCGDAVVEADVKNRLGVTVRCIPLDGADEPGTCVITGRPSARRVVWGKSY